jgi:hypothetical protein
MKYYYIESRGGEHMLIRAATEQGALGHAQQSLGPVMREGEEEPWLIAYEMTLETAEE